MSIEQAMCKLYEHEINFSISSFWDSGFTLKIGDEWNGFKVEVNDVRPEEIAETLMELAKSVYPTVDFEAEMIQK